MKSPITIGVIAVMVLLMALPLLYACNGGNGTEKPSSPTATTTPTPMPTEKVTVTIGNHTDKTGVASNAMQYVDLALADTIEYYNENSLSL